MPLPSDSTPHPEPDPDDVELFLRGLWRFQRALGKQVAPLLQERHGLDPREFFLLHSVRGGIAYPKELAAELNVPSSLLSRYLDDLHKRGLLERRIDEHDSRRTRLSLTPAAHDTLRQASASVNGVVGRHLARLSRAQRVALADALHALAEPAPEGSPA